ncbi:hypothetical protein ACOMHN_020028 [Nucella lapillus]
MLLTSTMQTSWLLTSNMQTSWLLTSTMQTSWLLTSTMQTSWLLTSTMQTSWLLTSTILVTKHGILKGAYTRNEFELCPQKLLFLSEMNCVKHVSLREAVILGSQSGGQGYVKCNCSGAKKCQNNRCKCFKAKLKCNSRCHQSLTCGNK